MANVLSGPAGTNKVTPPEGFMSSVRAEADRLLADGFAVVMLGYQSKAPPPVEPLRFDTKNGNPILMKRERCIVTQDNINQLLGNQPRNIGVLLGADSNNRVDIDLDYPIARPLAKLLFESAPRFGRLSAKSSHIIVECPAAKSLKFTLPTSMKDNDRLPDKHALCVLELRSDRTYSVFPPSIHRDTGEAISWEIKGDFPIFEFQALKAKLGLLAFLSAVAQFWPKEGTRDDTAMALAGALLAAGLDPEEADFFARAVAEEAGDEEWQKRGKAVATAAKMQAGEPVTGLPKLVELLGLPEVCIPTFRDWLCIKGGPSTAIGRAHSTHSPDCVDPKRPYDIAKQFIGEYHSFEGHRTIAYHNREYYLSGNGIYEVVETDAIRQKIYQFLDTKTVFVPKVGEVPIDLNPRMINNVEDGLRALSLVPRHKVSPPCWLDGVGPKANELMVVDNGILHVPSGELLPHTPRLFALAKISIPYDPNAPLPVVWLGFLESVFKNTSDVIPVLQEMMGYMLVADTSQHKAFMLIGPPRCGRSTIARILEKLVGKDYFAGIKLNTLSEQFGMQSLIPKLVAVVTDARMSARTDRGSLMETVLNITGDDSVTVARKNQTAWEGHLMFRLLVIANELPKFEDMSGAFASRFILLTTDMSFLGKEDLSLGEKLEAELPGILLWAIDGLRRLKDRGKFVQPESSAMLIRHFEMASSPALAFVTDCCVLEPDAVVSKDTLYNAYTQWQASEGRTYALDKNTFASKLYSAFPGLITEGRPREGGKRSYVFRGIRLLTPEELKNREM